MSRTFKLARFDDNVRPVPAQGEDLGLELAGCALRMEKQLITQHGQIFDHHKDRLATLFELAADAYDMGASSCLGHGRMNRYLEASRKWAAKAAELRSSK